MNEHLSFSIQLLKLTKVNHLEAVLSSVNVARRHELDVLKSCINLLHLQSAC